ncbi:hypothetical protein ACC754_02605 [Rhizobium johnstonii]
MPAETVRQAFILAALEAGVPLDDDENGIAAAPDAEFRSRED